MAKKSSKAAGKKKNNIGLMGWKLQSFLQSSAASRKSKSYDACVYYVSSDKEFSALQKNLLEELGGFQVKSLSKTKAVQQVMSESAAIWILHPQEPKADLKKRNRGRLAPSPFAMARDLMGTVVSEFEAKGAKNCQVVAGEASSEEKLGLLVGAEIGSYTFKKAIANKTPNVKIHWEGFSKALMNEAEALGVGTNLARHLVNVPANELYPESYANLIESLFAKKAGVKVDVWDEKKIVKENMNLITAVGGAADYQPRFVHIRYRPKGGSKQKPLALVGKGLCFDSGGLDIKPAGAMRNMKKDMGGSAAIVGLFYSLVNSDYKKPLDIYLPMAENAISGSSFRPGDVFKTRSGKTVEIHNTDAEGRLVLAEALTYASEQKGEHKPRAIINVATLTGAVKVGLGVGMGGFFSNEDALAEKIEDASQSIGDLMWEMPLFEDYRSLLKSNVADINHCASGFGGAITAALFLFDFVEPQKFAHFDIYAWADRAKGAVREAGGSGQGVQCLYQLMKQY